MSERSTRAGRDGRPRPGDLGEIGDDYRLHDKQQDRAFQDAMLNAMSRRQERMPPIERPRPPDSVPHRPFAASRPLSASNLEN